MAIGAPMWWVRALEACVASGTCRRPRRRTIRGVSTREGGSSPVETVGGAAGGEGGGWAGEGARRESHRGEGGRDARGRQRREGS